MANLTPNRRDRLRDKLIAIEIRARKIEECAYEARHSGIDCDDELKKHSKEIGKVHNELNIMINTTEEQGRVWGWWE